jgi:hypothetical protein
MYPNPALSAWQLAIMAVVPVVTMAVWLIAIYVAAREPRGHNLAAAASPAESATAGIGSRVPASAGRAEPERPPAGRAAA